MPIIIRGTDHELACRLDANSLIMIIMSLSPNAELAFTIRGTELAQSPS